MKHWKLLLVPIVLLIMGCSTISYDISLEKVNIVNPSNEEFTNIIKDDINKYTFNDDKIKISWILSASQFNFNLLNQTTEPMEIIWDKCTYIDINNKNHRLIHSGVKYVERNNSHPNTIIIPNSSIDDMIYPSDYVYYVEGKNGGWKERPLFDFLRELNSNIEEKNDSNIIKKYIGKTVQTMLTLQINNDIYSYIFIFRINDYKLIKE